MELKLYEFTMFATSFGSTFITPVMFGVMVLHPRQPFHQFLKWSIGYSPRLSLTSLPVMAFSAMAGQKASSVCTFLLSTGILYMRMVRFWVGNCTPNSVDHALAKYRTVLGILSTQKLFWVYRCHQIIDRAIHEVYKYVAFHLITVRIMIAVPAFGLIRYANVLTGVYVMIIATPILVATGITMFEVLFVSRVFNASVGFVKGMGQGEMRKSYIFKKVRSCWIVRFDTSYPFFKMENSSFLSLMSSAVDLTITLLMEVQ